MNNLQKYILKLILKKLFKQNFDHMNNLELVYKLIRKTWEEEFTEDGTSTTNYVLYSKFVESQKY